MITSSTSVLGTWPVPQAYVLSKGDTYGGCMSRSWSRSALPQVAFLIWQMKEKWPCPALVREKVSLWPKRLAWGGLFYSQRTGGHSYSITSEAKNMRRALILYKSPSHCNRAQSTWIPLHLFSLESMVHSCLNSWHNRLHDMLTHQQCAINGCQTQQSRAGTGGTKSHLCRRSAVKGEKNRFESQIHPGSNSCFATHYETWNKSLFSLSHKLVIKSTQNGVCED